MTLPVLLALSLYASPQLLGGEAAEVVQAAEPEAVRVQGLEQAVGGAMADQEPVRGPDQVPGPDQVLAPD